ncbi:hypothetical protein TorRG33x02_075000, partial [Trema orientale]
MDEVLDMVCNQLVASSRFSGKEKRKVLANLTTGEVLELAKEWIDETQREPYTIVDE